MRKCYSKQCVTCVWLAWYGTNANLINDRELYAGIHTIFLWDCLVRWLETNKFTMIGRANKHHRELAYMYKKTHLMIKHYDHYVMKSTELSSIMYQDHQQVAKQWIHWFPGIYSHLDETRPFPYTMKRQYTEAHVTWITVSYTRASFIPIIYSTILRDNKHYLAISAYDWKQCTTNPVQVICYETFWTDGGPNLHEPQVSSTH